MCLIKIYSLQMKSLLNVFTGEERSSAKEWKGGWKSPIIRRSLCSGTRMVNCVVFCCWLNSEIFRKPIRWAHFQRRLIAPSSVRLCTRRGELNFKIATTTPTPRAHSSLLDMKLKCTDAEILGVQSKMFPINSQFTPDSGNRVSLFFPLKSSTLFSISDGLKTHSNSLFWKTIERVCNVVLWISWFFVSSWVSFFFDFYSLVSVSTTQTK